MKAIKAISFVAVSTASDPCAQICEIDRNTICTGGSELIENERICTNYFITPDGPRCYRDANTRHTCLDTFRPLRVEMARAILANREEEARIGTQPQPSSEADAPLSNAHNASQNQVPHVVEGSPNSLISTSNIVSSGTVSAVEIPAQEGTRPSGPVRINMPRGPVQVNIPRTNTVSSQVANSEPQTAQVSVPRGPVQINLPRPQVQPNQTQGPVNLPNPVVATQEITEETIQTSIVPRRRRVFPAGQVPVIPRVNAQSIVSETVQYTVNTPEPLTVQNTVNTPEPPTGQTRRRRVFPAGANIQVIARVEEVQTPPRRFRAQPSQQPAPQTSPAPRQPINVVAIDPFDRIGNAVRNAITGRNSFDDVIRQFVALIRNQEQDIISNYQESWSKIGGAELFAAASRSDCGAAGYRARDACFTYMLVATHMPIPGTAGSAEFNEALAHIGLTAFTSIREENLRLMLDESRVARNNGSFGLQVDEIYMESFGHNWIVRCPTVTGTSASRRAVFRHRLYRYTSLNDPAGLSGTAVREVRRESVFLDSAAVLNQSADRIRRGIESVRFAELVTGADNRTVLQQEGAYGDGVRRDWFTSVARDITVSNYGFFERQGVWNVLSPMSEGGDLGIFGTIGRFFALALVQGIEIDALFPRSFIARLLDQDVTIEMLGELDEELAFSLQYTLDCSNEEVGEIGEPVADSGFTEPVSASNRQEQVQAALNNLGVNKQGRQFDRLFQAFHEVIPVEIFDGLTVDDFESLIYGAREIVIGNDFYTLVDHWGVPADSLELGSLLTILQEYDQEHRRLFVRFVTGNSQLPVGGFGKMTERIQIARENISNPIGRTCFLKLTIPAKQSNQTDAEYLTQLRDRLTQGLLALTLPVTGMSEGAVNSG